MYNHVCIHDLYIHHLGSLVRSFCVFFRTAQRSTSTYVVAWKKFIDDIDVSLSHIVPHYGFVWKWCTPRFVWKWCTPLYPMVLLIIIPFLNGYFIGNINPTFSDIPICFCKTHSKPGIAKSKLSSKSGRFGVPRRDMFRQAKNNYHMPTFIRHITYIYIYMYNSVLSYGYCPLSNY